MTVAYDMERLAVSLDAVRRDADAILRNHAGVLEEWQVHRLAHIRDEATSLVEQLKGETA